MPRVQLIALVALVLFGANAAHAQSSDAVCAAYKSNWDQVRSGGNLTAMASAAGSISAECPTLRREANAAVAEARRASEHSAAAHTQTARTDRLRYQEDKAAIAAAAADDAAYSMAQNINTVSAYNAYISSYPNGRHVAQANAAVQPAPTPGSGPIVVNVCNKAKTDISVATVYKPTNETDNWRYIGWYVVHPAGCSIIANTYDPTFYLYAKGTDGITWGAQPIGKDQPAKHCLVANAAYDFLLKSSEVNCPNNATVQPFFTITSGVTSGDYTFNFVLN